MIELQIEELRKGRRSVRLESCEESSMRPSSLHLKRSLISQLPPVERNLKLHFSNL